MSSVIQETGRFYGNQVFSFHQQQVRCISSMEKCATLGSFSCLAAGQAVVSAVPERQSVEAERTCLYKMMYRHMKKRLPGCSFSRDT